jgi:hypothetical protein
MRLEPGSGDARRFSLFVAGSSLPAIESGPLALCPFPLEFARDGVLADDDLVSRRLRLAGGGGARDSPRWGLVEATTEGSPGGRGGDEADAQGLDRPVVKPGPVHATSVPAVSFEPGAYPSGPVALTTAMVDWPAPEGDEHETSTVLCGPLTMGGSLVRVHCAEPSLDDTTIW